MMTTTRELPEAGASATAKAASSKGFHWLFTIRDSSGTGLFPKLAAFEETVLAEGWSPGAGFFKDEPATGRKGRSRRERGATVIEETTCATWGEPATRKRGMRKEKSWWEGIFCSTGDETHRVWLK